MTEKVLLVDDEEEFVKTLAERMKTRGMDVSTSTSAMEALGKLEEQNFDAVVLDLMMPGVDGLQALKIIKQNQPEIQVILLTGHASVKSGVEAIKLGATEFLEKPANIEVLTEKIRRAQAEKMILVEKKTEEKIKKIMSEKSW
jgi:DNA-binding NtrC family response regulator